MNAGRLDAPFKYAYSLMANLKDVSGLRKLLRLCL